MQNRNIQEKRTLHLSLKRKWYDMIASGEKTEEYREITPYWIKRLVDECLTDRDGAQRRWKIYDKAAQYYAERIDLLRSELAGGVAAFKCFDDVHFTLGYPKADDASRHMVKRIKEIVIGTGRPEWGAAPGRMYFVIKLVERL